MSFSGDLEYLPIVDVVQLVHAARKSGILRVKSRKGESDLVFKDGSIVSASHLNKSVRIGSILVQRNVITPQILDQALLEQRNAGTERKPLIITLRDKGLVKEEDAYRGLEHLIEMTIVEILTWKRGTFTMGVLPHAVADGYRYYPDRMSREINVDAQGVLMDALRIFDEKMRDGELTEEEIPDGDGAMTGTVPHEQVPADDLCLMRQELLENLEREKRKERQQYAAIDTFLRQDEPVHEAPVITVPVQYLGRGAVLVGLVMLACGVKGLLEYSQIHPAAAAFPEIEKTPGPFGLYLANGLIPTLQALLGMYTALAGSWFLQMRPRAGKRLEVAAWCAIAFAVVSGLDNMIASIKRASSSPSFWYYLVEFAGFILMAALWTVPLLALLWFLRRYDISDVSIPPAPLSRAASPSLPAALPLTTRGYGRRKGNHAGAYWS